MFQDRMVGIKVLSGMPMTTKLQKLAPPRSSQTPNRHVLFFAGVLKEKSTQPFNSGKIDESK